MKPLFLTVSLTALLAATPVLAQNSKSETGTMPSTHATSNKQSADDQFIRHVTRANRAEVELGQLAQQKSSSQDVKMLGQHLAADHEKSNQQLAQIAQKEGVQPPSGIGRENNALRDRLEKLNGQAFDRAFVQAQVEDHQKDIQYLQQAENRVQDPSLKSYIRQTLPVLQQHLQMAEQTEHQMTGSGSSSHSGSTSRSSGTSR